MYFSCGTTFENGGTSPGVGETFDIDPALAADYHLAPAALRKRVAAGGGATPPAPHRPRSSLVSALQRWLAWRPMAGSFALAAAALIALNLAWLHAADDERVLDDVVASHVRATLGQHLVDVASSDHHTVKPWLSSRLDFSPPVAELQLPGSAFLGGRVDYLDGRPVAALVYRQGPHVVSSFVWPASAKDSRPDFAQTRGFQTAHRRHAGMQHWVISDVNRAEFDAVVQAIRGAEGAR
jgi:anti-sigma factor RsiW